MDNRNYGIDLLRIIAMFAVVILHIQVFGGVINNVKEFSVNYEIAWTLETLCYCAVDIYVIITGYVYAS